MQPKGRGRPKRPLVTGYLIGDDSTMQKPKGKKMEGLGQHHATTADRRLPGQSMVEGRYVLLGQRCPLLPQLYRPQAVCEQEGVPFQSKIELMEATIRAFEPVADTRTQVLLDSWYCAKVLWHAARERGFAITTGTKSNRSVRLADASEARGWRWQRLSDYAASLDKSAVVECKWPRGGKTVYVHVVTTQVRKLYRCRVVSVRQSRDAPLSQTR